jgi:cation-transporting ATPase G
LITAPIPLALVGAARLAAMALVHERAEVIVIANDVRAGRSSGSPDFC